MDMHNMRKARSHCALHSLRLAYLSSAIVQLGRVINQQRKVTEMLSAKFRMSYVQITTSS